MKVPFSWLQSLVTKKLHASQVAEKLTSFGLEIEGIEKPKEFGQFFVVGKVVKCEKHPHADRLHVCEVKTGKKETRTIVCGAPNVKLGQTVAVALPGATVAGGKTISEAEIRGIKSHGMICAEDELGTGASHDGIVVLDDALEAGSLLDDANIVETIVDMEVTLNRPDWLSVFGVAREVALAERTKICDIELDFKESAPVFATSRTISVAKSTAEQYHLKGATEIEAVETPQWMKSRLGALGLGSNGFIVDVTNYVLYELGQPLHVFDADKVRGKKIFVRFAKPKETMTLLNDKTYTLTSEDIVIADARGPIALAGIMGGKVAAVTKETRNVIIESAIFPQIHIRHTSRRLGLRTDASNRFEKGITSDVPKRALLRALSLLQRYTHARVMRGMLSFVVPQKKQKPLTVSLKRMNQLLGVRLPMALAKEMLVRLSFDVKSKGTDQLIVVPPVFRVDIALEADVAEELARVFGYSKLGLTLPRMQTKPSVVDDMLKLQSEIRNMSVRLGFTELLQPSFYGEEKLVWAMLPESEHRTVVNPMDSEQQYLRTDVLPGMISAVEKNRKALSRVKVFEIGQVFWKHMKPGMHEWRIGWAASFQEGGEFIEIQEDVAEIFSLVLGVAKRDIYIGAGTQTRDIKIGTAPIGILVVRPLRKGMTVACVECSLHELLAHKSKRAYVPQSKFPSVLRDIAVTVPVSMDSFTLRRQLHQASTHVIACELFDVHPQSDATVSCAFHLEFASNDHTLDAREIDLEMTSIARALQQKGGIVRT